MAKFLQDLLGAKDPLFSASLQKLERATGQTGVDVKLIGDITHHAHAVMRKLGLDPADTTKEELENALNAHADNEGMYEKTAYAGLVIDGKVISFNQADIGENAKHALGHGRNSVDHMQCELSKEIIHRYTGVAGTDVTTVEQFLKDAGINACNHPEHLAQHEKAKKPASLSILSIGDIFTDAFITLGDETAKIIKEGDMEWLAVPFGRKPAYEHVDIVKSVGPSPNVAVSIARLGYNADLMAWVGGDDTGKEAIEYLKTQNVGTESMVVEADKATSYWYVLCYHADRTMLVKSEKYRYEWRDPVTKPEWIYLSYLGEDSWPLHEGLLDYLERNPDIKLAFQPGTFQFNWGAKRLVGMYRRSHVVLMNREEAMDVTGRPYDSVKHLADGLHELGPEIVVITDGPKGSYVSHAGKVLTIPNYPDPVPPVERTGAGDAFSSTFIAAIAAGESIETALAWAPINSMNVVQHIGAQAGLLKKEDIMRYLAEAPDWYKVTELKG